MKIIEGKIFTPEEQNLFDELEILVPMMEEIGRSRPKEDLSKHWIVFAHNYFSLEQTTKANEMLEKVSENYIADVWAADLEYAMKCRDESIQLENRRKFKESGEKWKEAEYFLVFVYLVPKLNEQEWFRKKHKKALDKFAKTLNEKKLQVRTDFPKIQLIE